MITRQDQLDLFRIISENISQDVGCYAFGGTAMMFYGYKDETKDIDLLFKTSKERGIFIEALIKLGFVETSPIFFYIPEKLKDRSKPLMFKRGDIRFDLFAGKIFRTLLSPKMEEDKYAVHDFKGKYNLRITILKTEQIVLLKAITERQNDIDDIKAILSKDKNFNWQYAVDEAVWQHEHGDSWVLIDLEKTIRELRKYVFIEEKYLKQIYAAQDGKKKR